MAENDESASRVDPPQALAYRVPRDADARPPAPLSVVAGLVLVAVAGGMLLGGLSILGDLRGVSEDYRLFGLMAVLGFSFACLVAGLLALFGTLRRLP